MQFIPVDDTGSSRSLWDSPAKSSSGDSAQADFLQAVHKAVESVAKGDNATVNEALSAADIPAVRVDSPYSRPTVNGVTYTLEEVNFTKSELQELRAQLLKNGAPEESLKRLDALINQPDGAVLAQVLASLQQAQREVKLSTEDSDNITALLGKIDPTGDLGTEALALMGAGRGQDALRLITAAFDKLNPSETVELDKAEILSLGRGLGLNQSSLQALSADFGNFSALRSNSSQFAALMAPAITQFSSDAAAQQKLDAAASKVLQPLISKARDRMEKENEAVSRESRKVQLGKTLIDRTVQTAGREILDDTLKSGQNAGATQNAQEIASAHSAVLAQSQKAGGKSGKDAEDAKPAKGNSAETPLAASEAAGRATAELAAAKSAAGNAGVAANREGQAGDRTADQAAQAAAGRNNRYGENFEDNGRNTGNNDARNDSGDKKEWNSLLNKVEVRGAAVETPRDSIVYSLLHPATAQAATNAHEQTRSADLTRLSQQAARQVEQGVLTTLRNGGTRLDLQLNPEELGAITLTLTARNGEVSALIRSERTETSEMIARQVDAIRINLEQQGIKVDKIEVQLQQQDQNQGESWKNFDQHNARQEEDARREELARLKNLATIRNSTSNDDLNTLEQPVQYSLHTAINAGRALNVVA